VPVEIDRERQVDMPCAGRRGRRRPLKRLGLKVDPGGAGREYSQMPLGKFSPLMNSVSRGDDSTVISDIIEALPPALSASHVRDRPLS
jgi:hypothetical protein